MKQTRQFELAPRWTDRFPSSSGAQVTLIWEPTELELDFSIQEDQIRALETDPWLVHRDSCAEFFFMLPEGKEYYNIEVNPVGTILFAVGSGRKNRTDLTGSHGKSISIDGPFVGKKPFDVLTGEWSVKLRLPPALFGLSGWESLAGGLKGNMYKCGDGLDQPHYLSWAPLSSTDPDFHRPKDFRTLFSF